jgi:hypothetical protein
MLFDINTAMKVRDYYEPVLIGLPLRKNIKESITHIFVVTKGTYLSSYFEFKESGYDPEYPKVYSAEGEKDVEIYLYSDDGITATGCELDFILTEKGIYKIYK